MNIAAIDEREFVQSYRANNIQDFLSWVEAYEKQIAVQMRARGYKRVNASERTVVFTFGEITFSRSRWKKKHRTVVPVDKRLGLVKHSRFSPELMYQVAKLALHLPYRKVAKVVELMYQVYITKDTVLQAVRLGEKLLEEREDYRYFEEAEAPEKIKAKVIFVEGDGVAVKTTNQESGSRRLDLSHYVIHTGSYATKNKNRRQLLNKKEIIHAKKKVALEQVIDYLYNHYDITPETLLITTSDMGLGYSYEAFKEIASALKIQHHEHFWDPYHVKKLIEDFYRHYPGDVKHQVLEAVRMHDKATLKLLLDTTESLLETEEEEQGFTDFSKRLLRLFKFTKPAHLRGLKAKGIGVIESQHRKITYRMKRRGMYWSVEGAKAVSQMILLETERAMRELFFGDWRQRYQEMKEVEVSVRELFKVDERPREDRKYQLFSQARKVIKLISK